MNETYSYLDGKYITFLYNFVLSLGYPGQVTHCFFKKNCLAFIL